MKRTTAIVFGVALLLASVAAAVSGGGGSGYTGDTTTGDGTTVNAGTLFTDVPVDHWAYEDLQYLAERGIISGLPGGKYNGDEPLDRYSAAAMIARAMRYLQNNPESVTADDLDVLKDLIFQVSDDVNALQQGGSSDLAARVSANEKAIAALRSDLNANGGGTDVAALTKRVQANFIISLTALLVGIIGVALATLGL